VLRVVCSAGIFSWKVVVEFLEKDDTILDANYNMFLAFTAILYDPLNTCSYVIAGQNPFILQELSWIPQLPLI
jgi:hypothetical protein